MTQKEIITKFAKAFDINTFTVECAYDQMVKLFDETREFEGKELKTRIEVNLFNVLGEINQSNNICNVAMRSGLALDIICAMDLNEEYDYELGQDEVRLIAGWVTVQDTIKNKLIEKSFDEYPHAHAPYFGPYTAFEYAGHYCPYEYCIEKYPMNEEFDGKGCPHFGRTCPSGAVCDKIKIDYGE